MTKRLYQRSRINTIPLVPWLYRSACHIATSKHGNVPIQLTYPVELSTNRGSKFASSFMKMSQGYDWNIKMHYVLTVKVR